MDWMEAIVVFVAVASPRPETKMKVGGSIAAEKNRAPSLKTTSARDARQLRSPDANLQAPACRTQRHA
jgi:hypothetical protein